MNCFASLPASRPPRFGWRASARSWRPRTKATAWLVIALAAIACGPEVAAGDAPAERQRIAFINGSLIVRTRDNIGHGADKIRNLRIGGTRQSHVRRREQMRPLSQRAGAQRGFEQMTVVRRVQHHRSMH